jgi:hypothetical protein
MILCYRVLTGSFETKKACPHYNGAQWSSTCAGCDYAITEEQIIHWKRQELGAGS